MTSNAFVGLVLAVVEFAACVALMKPAELSVSVAADERDVRAGFGTSLASVVNLSESAAVEAEPLSLVYLSLELIVPFLQL